MIYGYKSLQISKIILIFFNNIDVKLLVCLFLSVDAAILANVSLLKLKITYETSIYKSFIQSANDSIGYSM